VIEEIQPTEISIGDYVLSGGELAAMVLIDAVVRLIPGVLGHADSAAEDSFAVRGEIQEVAGRDGRGANRGAMGDGQGQRLLDCPHYTRPRIWKDRAVPEVLLSGDHAAVDEWRMQRMIERTRERRPDLLE